MLITTTEIINRSLKLYKENWKELIKYPLVLLIPTVLLSLVKLARPFFALGTGILISLVAVIILMIIISIMALWIGVALIRVINNKYENKPTQNLKQELLSATHYIWPLILSSILSSLIIFGGLLLLIIPGIIFMVWFAFTNFSVILDNKQPVSALKHSKSLVQGRWLAVFWRLFAPAIIIGIFALILQWGIGSTFGMCGKLLIKSLNLSQNNIFYLIFYGIMAVINGGINVAMIPLTTAAPLILYSELVKNPVVTEKIPEQIK